MAQTYIKLHGYWLYYDDAKYNEYKDVIYYLETLEEGELKTFFDAAYADGKADFETKYGYNYSIVYDYSSKIYTLEPRQ